MGYKERNVWQESDACHPGHYETRGVGGSPTNRISEPQNRTQRWTQNTPKKKRNKKKRTQKNQYKQCGHD